jgi:hypothetical protein
VKLASLTPWVLLLCAPSAWAEPIDERSATQAAIESNPLLYAALLDVREADRAVAAEDDAYPLMLQLDAGVTHLRNPSLTDTDVITSTRDSIVMGSELRKAFSFGTSMALRLEGDWSRFSSPLFPGSDQEVTLGPAYGINARFAVLQP